MSARIGTFYYDNVEADGFTARTAQERGLKRMMLMLSFV
jgi:hypothetical protein